MKFGNLNYLFLLWIIPAMVLLSIYSFRKKAELLRLFCGTHLGERLTPHVLRRRQKFKVFLLLLATLFIICALLQPRWGFHWEEVTRKGVDILVALDVSESMRAQDVTPNRLERAKREVTDLVQMLRGDRIGLIAFAGVSFLECPLTLDYGAFKIFLDYVDTDLIPVPGTAIADAVRTAIKGFVPGRRASRALILITDGEDHEGNALAAAEEAKKNGIKIFAIGIGSDSGAPIPLRDGAGGFKKDRSGQMILSKLDETSLQKIALTTGGSYVRSVTGDMDLKRIYEEQIEQRMEATELKTTMHRKWEERFQWFLFAGILFFLLEGVLPERKRAARVLGWRWIIPRKATMSVLVAVSTLLCFIHAVYADSIGKKIRKAESSYNAQKYDEALQQFLDAQVELPENTALKFNLGNAYYRMANYQEAEKAFWGAATSGDPPLEEKAFYNLGNCAYRQGKLDEAVAHYQKALELDPKDEDARANLEFVREEIKRRINEAKKREEEQKSSEQKKEDSSQGKSCPNPSKSPGTTSEKGEESKSPNEQEQAQQPPMQEQPSQATGQEPNDQQQRQSEGDGQGTKVAQAQVMSQEEAERWLNTLSEEQKDLLKYQSQKIYGRRPQPIKDW